MGGATGLGTAVTGLREELLVVKQQGREAQTSGGCRRWGRRPGGWSLRAWASWGGEAGAKRE